MTPHLLSLRATQARISDDAAGANLLLDRTRNRLIKFDVAASTIAASTIASCNKKAVVRNG